MFFVQKLECVIRSELTLYKGWVSLANEGHSQYVLKVALPHLQESPNLSMALTQSL